MDRLMVIYTTRKYAGRRSPFTSHKAILLGVLTSGTKHARVILLTNKASSPHVCLLTYSLQASGRALWEISLTQVLPYLTHN